tara:strand:+ start:219 stop:731 length:513 start_codon:yes stop_codon:yes gene_type:complete
MADNTQGIRIGAAGHFSSRMTAALIASGQITAAQAMDTFADFTSQALDVLNSFEGAPVQATVVAQRAPAYVAAAPAQVAVPAGLAAMVDTSTVVVSQAAMPEIKNASSLMQDGINNGPLPEWLGPIAAKYGVGSVFDNRHQLADGPTRPHFRQAGVPKGQQAKGFWPDSK